MVSELCTPQNYICLTRITFFFFLICFKSKYFSEKDIEGKVLENCVCVCADTTINYFDLKNSANVLNSMRLKEVLPVLKNSDLSWDLWI